MALISKIEKETRNARLHNEVESTYNILISGDKKYFQINTFGTENREVMGIASQIIQFDENTAKKLIELLKEEFCL